MLNPPNSGIFELVEMHHISVFFNPDLVITKNSAIINKQYFGPLNLHKRIVDRARHQFNLSRNFLISVHTIYCIKLCTHILHLAVSVCAVKTCNSSAALML